MTDTHSGRTGPPSGHELDAPPWSRVEGTLISTARAVRAVYDHALKDLGISLVEATILANLAASGALTQVDLARELRTGKARIGVYIDHLASRGFVIRNADPADRRVWRVALTDVGRTTWEQSVEIDRRVRGSLRQGTTAAERAVLDAVLLQIERNAQQILGR
jgi:DNA-binding MarR family transcriptional regulator